MPGSVLWISLTLLLVLVLVDLGWRSAHLLLFDNVALLELLQTELHHFLLEISVLEHVLLTVVGIADHVRSQLVGGVDVVVQVQQLFNGVGIISRYIGFS